MPSSRCRQCGSSSFRADRSLAGRLICNSCGAPLGSAPGQVRRSGSSTGLFGFKPTRVRGWRFWLGLAMIVVLIVLIFR